MPTVRSFTTAEASENVLTTIRRLLVEAFEGDFSDDDWDHALGGWHVVVADGPDLVAHAAVVARTLEVADQPLRAGYVEGVGAAPSRHGAGFGSLAMVEMANVLRREFEMGALSTGAHPFYERLGWERWAGPSFVRHGAETIRTPDEDDGLMVLRYGPSADIDLTTPLTCQGRRGDDW